MSKKIYVIQHVMFKTVLFQLLNYFYETIQVKNYTSLFNLDCNQKLCFTISYKKFLITYLDLKICELSELVLL